MSYDFDEKIDRKGTNSVKWEFISVGDPESREEILPLSIADMDFACAPEILDTLKNRVDRKIFGYSLPHTDLYLNSVTTWFKKRFDWTFDATQVVTAPGVVPALAVLVKILSEKGEGVIIQNPVYYPFSSVIKANERVLVNNALVNNNGKYEIDFEDFEEKAKDQNNKVFILCSPHNPVGRVWTEDELTRILDICIANDVFVISDEIHCDIVRKDIVHTPLAKLSKDKRIIMCTAASKSFNIAGLQHSNIMFNDMSLKEKWDKELLGRCGLFGASTFGIVATQTAYDKCEYWIDDLNSYVTANLDYIDEFIKAKMPKAKYHTPEGTYFAWIDLRDYNLSVEELENIMVYDAKLALDEGYIFGEEGNGFERINVACPIEVIKDCMNRMESAINSRNK